VSRHHILPPIIYTPVPKPKKTESRRKTRRIQTDAATADTQDIDELGGVSGTGGPGRGAAPPSQNPFKPIDGAERRVPSTTGKLSESTLKELLLAQELEQGSAPDPGGVAPAAKK